MSSFSLADGVIAQYAGFFSLPVRDRVMMILPGLGEIVRGDDPFVKGIHEHVLDLAVFRGRHLLANLMGKTPCSTPWISRSSPCSTSRM